MKVRIVAMIKMIRDARAGECIQPDKLPFKAFRDHHDISVCEIHERENGNLGAFFHANMYIHLRTMDVFAYCHELFHAAHFIEFPNEYLLGLDDDNPIHTAMYYEHELLAEIGAVMLCRELKVDMKLDEIECYLRHCNFQIKRYYTWMEQVGTLMPAIQKVYDSIMEGVEL